MSDPLKNIIQVLLCLNLLRESPSHSVDKLILLTVHVHLHTVLYSILQSGFYMYSTAVVLPGFVTRNKE